VLGVSGCWFLVKQPDRQRTRDRITASTDHQMWAAYPLRTPPRVSDCYFPPPVGINHRRPVEDAFPVSRSSSPRAVVYPYELGLSCSLTQRKCARDSSFRPFCSISRPRKQRASVILSLSVAVDTEQELGANFEHLQSASTGRVDPDISFQAHHQSRIVLCLVPKKRIDY